jgi:hypothetical protein
MTATAQREREELTRRAADAERQRDNLLAALPTAVAQALTEAVTAEPEQDRMVADGQD